MNREELLKHYETLGLSEGVTFKQAEEAYKAQKAKFAEALDVDGRTENDELEIAALNKIEEAFTYVSYYLKSSGAGTEYEAQKKQRDKGLSTRGTTTYSGPVLKQIREEMDFDLEDISSNTKITVTTLKYIEAEKFEMLPPEVYLRGFLKSIAEHLALPIDRVKSDYMDRYLNWKNKHDKQQRGLAFKRNKNG